ncbi:MAG: pilus assembly protein PilM [Phycisphaerales bacterium]|nr:pilus assembly protein PilM [Phycisphaerales bacterium]
MSKERQLIIVEARPESLRLNFVRCGGDGVVECIDMCSIAPTDPNSEESSLLDQLALDSAADAIRERSDWRNAGLIVMVGGGEVGCHYFHMPALEGKALTQAVRLKLSQQLHFPLNEAVVDVCRSGDLKAAGDATVSVRATAVKKSVSKAAVAFAQQTRLELIGVTSSAVALSRLSEAEQTTPIDDVRATLQIDQSYSTLIVIGTEGPCLATELPVGLDDFTKALMRPIIAGDDVYQLEEADAIALRDQAGVPDRDADLGIHNLKGKNLLPLLEPALQRFAQQLTQWLTFAATTEGGGNVSRLQVIGIGASMPGLADSLGHRLKMDVESPDWLSRTAKSTSASRHNVEAFASASSAARFISDLPNLLPEEEFKRRRIARFRSSTTKAGPIVAAATLGVAFLFNQIGGHLSKAVGQVQMEMVRVQSMVDKNTQLQQERSAITAIKAKFDDFACHTPNWLGFFKELSLILPKEIRVTRLSTRNDGAELRVVIDGEVARSRNGQSYDETVEVTLTALERSPFASAVHLVNSSRNDSERGNFEGTLSVEVSLAYVVPPAAMEQ